MADAEGEEVYAVDAAAVRARGAAYDEAALDELLRERVIAVVLDVEGREDIRHLLADPPATEFEASRLADLIDEPRVLELWRVGEAIGEVFLVDCRDCFFPWPSGRDLKNPSASLPGADLVGFAVEGQSERFAFGEVKTSQSEDAPPSVMYGRSGLITQLEGLRDEIRVKDALVLYLGFRAQDAPWCDRYREAARRYFADHTDVSLFGVLVRDVEPNRTELARPPHFTSTQCGHCGFAEVVAPPGRAFDEPQVGEKLVVGRIGRRATVVDEDLEPDLTRVPGDRLAVLSVENGIAG